MNSSLAFSRRELGPPVLTRVNLCICCLLAIFPTVFSFRLTSFSGVEVLWILRVQLWTYVFNSASHSWAIEFNTQREIPYLRVPMYYSLLNKPFKITIVRSYRAREFAQNSHGQKTLLNLALWHHKAPTKHRCQAMSILFNQSGLLSNNSL